MTAKLAQMRYRFHRNRTVADILRQYRSTKGGEIMVLDNANDAYLDATGRVSERYAPQHFIGDVSHLHGAVRISAALAVVSAYRAVA